MDSHLTDPIEFIKLLKSQHKSIISTVYEIDNQAGGPTALKSSIEKLNRITDLLFDHLEKEDKQLYPTLVNNKETREIGKKYFYDMERLSCIALDFFKRYCTNREGLKIFIEDFINGYSVFRGLLRVRIKREESELYPAFILLQSGVLQSDVLNYVHEQEAKIQAGQKTIFVFGQNQSGLEAITLALEIGGHKVVSTRLVENVQSLLGNAKPDLLLLDIGQVNKDIKDLVMYLKDQISNTTPLVAYSSTREIKLDEKVRDKFDHCIKSSVDIEAFSEEVKQILCRQF